MLNLGFLSDNSAQALASVAVDVTKLQGYVQGAVDSQMAELAQKHGVNLQNIGEIGVGIDFSQNVLRNPLQNEFPLLNWLLTTGLSNTLRDAHNGEGLVIHRDPTTNEWMLVSPQSVGTLPPTDTTGDCCWVPFELMKCGSEVPLKMLCLRDCEPIMDSLVHKYVQKGKPNDLINYFLRKGESIASARERMAKLSMAFLTAKNVILGTTTTGTSVLKPFHGLLEVMEDASVIRILGSNPLSAFDSLACRLAVLDGGNYRIAVHPLTYMGLQKLVQPGKFGQLPDNWQKSASGQLTFMGYSFIIDKTMPVDMTTGTGEAWVMDGNVVGAFLATTLQPGENFVRNTFVENNVPAQGCATECTIYYNLGTVVSTNPNHLAVITDIPLSANCTGDALFGLEGLISPDTLVPYTR